MKSKTYVNGTKYILDAEFNNGSIVTLISHGNIYGKVKGDESEWETMLNRLTEIPEWAKPYIASQFQPPVHNEAPKEWEEQATKDYENGYESETSAIDKFMVADEAGEVYVKCSDCKGEIKNSICFCNRDDLSPAPLSGEDAGKGIGDLKQDLFDFFLWFRENGDLYIDKSIENMISIYIKTIPKP